MASSRKSTKTRTSPGGPARGSRRPRAVAPAAVPAAEPARAGEEIARAPQQERGQRRVDSILDAAEQVFAEAGADAATTQAIAERAGASVGSIYHFFPSKDAILLALAERYADRMRAVNALAMSLEDVHLPLDELFERIVWGHARFIDETPAFGVVTEATTRKYGSCAVTDKLHEAIVSQVRTFLQHRLPRMPVARREASTRLAVTIVGEAVESTVALPRAEREGILRELKDLLVRYYAPLDEEFGVVRGSKPASSRPRGLPRSPA